MNRARLLIVFVGGLLEPEAQRGQRSPELMRHVGGELPLARNQLGDAASARIEPLSRPVRF